MKKIMIAVAAAALTGIATAAECGECCDCDSKCTFGYRLKVMVRTTGSCSVTKRSACNECQTGAYRGPVIRRFMGVVYGKTGTDQGRCGDTLCGCNSWENNAYVAMWDYDNRTPMTLKASMTELWQLNRIGCFAADRQKAEMAFSIGFACNANNIENAAQMTFAGFGLCGNHGEQITLGAVSGYCAGVLPAGATYSVSQCQDVTECYTYAWNLCCNTEYKCAFTAAYGKWTLVWDSSIAANVHDGAATTTSKPLTTTEATTGWGTAVPVLLADGRKCKDVPCECTVQGSKTCQD